MTNTAETWLERPEDRSSLLLAACGALGLLGGLALIVTNVWGSLVVEGHDWMADTISYLAVGERQTIQDVGLYAYAAGIVAVAIGAAHLHLGGRRWSLGILCLAAIAAIVIVVGAREVYAPGPPRGVQIHIYLVYLMGVLWLAAPVLMAEGLGHVSRRLARWSVALGLLWAALAPVFFLVPTGYDGLVERLLALVTIAWVSTISVTFLRAVRRAG